MSPNDLFGVVVRSVGLILMLYGVWHLAYFLLGGKNRDGNKWDRAYFTTGIIFIVSGLIVLFDADALVHAVYR